MTAIVKEEMATEMNYLQMYRDHITGYKQYKNEKHPPAAQPAAMDEGPATEALYYSTNKSG